MSLEAIELDIIDELSIPDIDEQSIDDDIIIEESMALDEVSWAKPGTTAAPIPPAITKAAIRASCFFILAPWRLRVLLAKQ